jgi:hypothetical protein
MVGLLAYNLQVMCVCWFAKWLLGGPTGVQNWNWLYRLSTTLPPTHMVNTKESPALPTDECPLPGRANEVSSQDQLI